jgi:hypothetical protein
MLQTNEVASNKLLRDINKDIADAPIAKLAEINVNQLFRVMFEDIYYRGVVLEPIDSIGMVLVRLIDYGNEINVPIDTLKLPIPIMKNLNAFGFQIKFQSPRPVAIGDALDIKIKSINDEDVMTVLVEGENEIISIDDLEIIPIPLGVKTDLFCLDFSNIKQGYISACVYDPKAISNIDNIGPEISAYCARSKDAYQPIAGELCLAIFEDDEWYRAEVIKAIDSNKFEIMFIDYGNITTVSTSNIRKMPEEFMHHCFMNKCIVKGAPKNPSPDDMKKVVSYFEKNQIFSIESAGKEKGMYWIDVAALRW